MKTNQSVSHIARTAMAISLLSIHSLIAGDKPNEYSPTIEIENEGRVVEALSVKAVTRKDNLWLRIRMSRRSSMNFPGGCHLHIELYNRNGELLKTDYQKISPFGFHRHKIGRFRTRTIHYNSELNPADVERISIHAYQQKHDNE